LPRRSANLQLIQYFDKIATNNSKGYQTDSIYLDFAKAFDSVVHSKLFFKVSLFGINGLLFDWIKSFLVNRFQSVKVGSSLSDWTPVLSGVPQGSVLGPVLFVLFINDLTECCMDSDCMMYMFADDVKCLKCINSMQDCENLQAVLDKIENWSNLWQLPLARHKCQLISFYGKSEHIGFQYFINNCVLSTVDFIHDLGITLSNDLSFSRHIDMMCSKARCRSAMILKCFKSRDNLLLFKAFVSYVRPILEYCSNVWSPYRLCDIRRIESIQRSFTKKLRGLKELNYPDRLKTLNAESLETRRIKYDLSMYFKIIHGLVEIPRDALFKVRESRTRSNGLTLWKNKFNYNFERYIFKNRQINIWNLLTHSAVNSTELSHFTKYLDSLNLAPLILKAYNI
jgi:hypothetical protein